MCLLFSFCSFSSYCPPDSIDVLVASDPAWYVSSFSCFSSFISVTHLTLQLSSRVLSSLPAPCLHSCNLIICLFVADVAFDWHLLLSHPVFVLHTTYLPTCWMMIYRSADSVCILSFRSFLSLPHCLYELLYSINRC